VFFSCVFLSILLNIGLYFYTVKKHVFVFMHTAKSLKSKKIILYFHTTNKTSIYIYIYVKLQYIICFSMHLGFNNQFIKVTRTRSIFQKTPKKIFCFLLISGITNLYVKRTPDIKKVVFLFDVSIVRFYPIR
jgi:hypothetical protein